MAYNSLRFDFMCSKDAANPGLFLSTSDTLVHSSV